MVESRSLQRWILALVAVAGGVGILFLPDLLFGGAHPGRDSAVVLAKSVSALAAVAWAAVFALAAFRRADEFNQERSKFAWYWGSLFGLAAATPLAAFIGAGGTRWLNPAAATDPQIAHAFALGVLLPLAAQVVGFAAVSLWWRATRR